MISTLASRPPATDLRHPSGPRRVLITLDAVGGVGRYAVDLARGLAASGVETLLLGFGPRPAPAFAQECRAVPHAELAWSDTGLDWCDDADLAAQTADLALRIARWKPDLVHLNAPALAADLETDRPLVAALHSCTATWWAAMRDAPLPPEWRGRRDRVARGLARAHRAVAPSRAFAEAARAVYGPLPQLRVVPNGVAPRAEANADEPFVFAAARWWDEAKDAAALDAAAALCRWPVFMAGPLEGPQGQRVALAHANAMGPLPAAGVAETLSRAAIFVSPSRYEPFGLATLEAAAAGAALVLADIPTYREFWEGAAVFVPPGDGPAFAAAIDALAADGNTRRRLAARARLAAFGLDLARQARAIRAIHLEAMRGA